MYFGLSLYMMLLGGGASLRLLGRKLKHLRKPKTAAA